MEERLAQLEAAIHELERLRRLYSPDDVYRDRHLDWALRYGLLEAIQIVIDVSCHLAARRNLGAPASYAECIRLLRKAGLLDEALASTLVRMVGLRKILVHEYANVDVARLYGLLDQLDDFRRFAEQVHPLL